MNPEIILAFIVMVCVCVLLIAIAIFGLLKMIQCILNALDEILDQITYMRGKR